MRFQKFNKLETSITTESQVHSIINLGIVKRLIKYSSKKVLVKVQFFPIVFKDISFQW